jgi:hypothetical protein
MTDDEALKEYPWCSSRRELASRGKIRTLSQRPTSTRS